MLSLNHSARSIRSIAAASCAAAALALAAAPASADVVYETNNPFGGFFLVGFDIFDAQSVGVRFTPKSDYTLDSLGLWFMNNDADGGHPEVTVTLRPSVNGVPGETILESWTFNIGSVGWNPELETLQSVVHPVLQSEVDYYIVAESDSGPFINAVWCWAANDSGYTSICNGNPCTFDPPPPEEGAVAACVVEGTPLIDCPADIDGDGSVSVADLLAVISAWGATGANPADVNGDSVVNVADLLMVISEWGACG